MPLNWDDDDEEDLTEIDYKRKRGSKVLIHEEITSPMGTPVPRSAPGSEPVFPPPLEPKPPPYIPRPKVPTPAALPLAFQPASLRDRFAAFFLDSALGFYLYWLAAHFLMKFFAAPSMAVLYQSSGRKGIHIALTVGILFFYYILMESVFGATLGKLFCRLRVIEESGENVSLGNVFIRNILRVVDYFPVFLIAVISMESSPLHQRMGDRAAKTLVIKKTRRYLKPVDLVHTPLASTLSRIFAAAVDGVMVFFLLYGFLLLMRPTLPLLSYVMFVSIPVVFVLYFTFLEFFTGTTPGKMLFKRQVVLENGEPPDGTSALIRNLFRPVDLLLGYPLMVLSRHKQRLGDTAADTLVVARSPGRRGVLGSFAALACVVVVAYLGFHNPNNYIQKDYGLGPWEGMKIFLPGFHPQAVNTAPPVTPNTPPPPVKTPETMNSKANFSTDMPASTSDKLKLLEFYFSAGSTPAQVRPDMIFKSGDLIYAFFKVEGFSVDPDKNASCTEDVVVEDSQGKEVLRQEKIVEITKPLDEKAPAILFANHLKTAKELSVGKYRAVFTVKDQSAHTEFSFEKFFEVQ